MSFFTDTLCNERPVLLAPMAGVTDAAFRGICAELGASGTISEMVSAKAVTMGDTVSVDIARRRGSSCPYGVQIFSSDAATAAEAVRMLQAADGVCADWFDLNCGCPAPKIVRSGCGSELLRDIDKIYAIIAAMKRATELPVTAKMRIGINSTSIVATEAARAAEAAGADCITVHGRTRAQMYAPPVDLDTIAQVVEAVRIPVIANGDIFTPQDAQNAIRRTGCAGVMIGRGALGRPWIFASVGDALEGRDIRPEPSVEERMRIMLLHIARLRDEEGEKSAMLRARKHAAWYTKGIHGAAAMRREMNKMSTFADLESLAHHISECGSLRTDTKYSAPQFNNF